MPEDAQKSILIVEDDKKVRTSIMRFFGRKGWKAEIAENGKKALKILKDKGFQFDSVLLDLRMPEMDGRTLLRELNAKHQADMPPIVLLSAYVNENDYQKWATLGATDIVKKPTENEKLEIIATGAKTKKSISEDVEKREASLNDYFKAAITEAQLSPATGAAEPLPEPVLVVCRRWNSWYPSYFDVPGGGYAIIVPGKTQEAKNVALIDPGFECLKVLAQLRISVKKISTCVTTHNHPDHIGGIFEYMACRHAAGKRSRLLCNRSTCNMFSNTAGFNLQVVELSDKNDQELFANSMPGNWSRLTVRGIITDHTEIGPTNETMGLVISSCKQDNCISEVVILGDTNYSPLTHRDRFISLLGSNHIKLAVLHMGSSQLKAGPGKHLYLPGLEKLLDDMKSQLRASGYNGKLLVLVSEWGLEHATKAQIKRICGKPIPGFGNNSPILDTINMLKDRLDHITLIPADIGLTVGIESGKIYLNGSPKSPDTVKVSVDEKGLVYS